MSSTYGAPYYILHVRAGRVHEFCLNNEQRADLCAMLYRLVRDRVRFRFDSKVVALDGKAPRPTVTLQNGAKIDADLIVGADGVASSVRALAFPEVDKPSPTGDAVFRSLVCIPHNSQSGRTTFSRPVIECWLGPSRHIVLYPIVRVHTALT